MLKNLMLWLDDTQLTVRLRINEFVTSYPRTKLYLIGGILLLTLLPLILVGCVPQVTTRCGADRSLIQELPLPTKPERPTNGDLATSHNGMISMIALDNERKARLVKQLSECQ